MGLQICHKKFLQVLTTGCSCILSWSFITNWRIQSHGGDWSKFFRTQKKRKKKATIILFVLQFCSWLKYPPSYLVWVTLKEEESSRDKIDQRKIKWKMKTHTHTHTHTFVDKIADTQCNQIKKLNSIETFKWMTIATSTTISHTFHHFWWGVCCMRTPSPPTLKHKYTWILMCIRVLTWFCTSICRIGIKKSTKDIE